MKAQVLRENFTKALQLASKFTSNKTQLPILANVLLKTEKNTLKLLATNLEMGIAISIGANVETEGEIAVPARTLAEIIASLRSEQVNLSTEKENLAIITDLFKSSLAGINTADFPVVPQAIDGSACKLDTVAFKKALQKTLFCVSLDESRPILTGVALEFTKKGLVVVATDGFRLSVQTIELRETGFESVVVPRNILLELSKIEESEISFSINPKSNQISFQLPHALLSSRIMQGEFPNYKKIIPAASETKVVLDKEDFLAAVKLASVFARDTGNVIRMIVAKKEIRLMSESGQVGKQETKVEAKVEGAEIEIAFNFKFVIDALQVIESDQVTIELAGQNSPAKFLDDTDSNFLHLIMPVKI